MCILKLKGVCHCVPNNKFKLNFSYIKNICNVLKLSLFFSCKILINTRYQLIYRELMVLLSMTMKAVKIKPRVDIWNMDTW